MNKKNNVLTIALILITLILGGLSFFIGMQLNQPSEEVTQEEIKPADISYKRDLALDQISPTSFVSTQNDMITRKPLIPSGNPTPTISRETRSTSISTLSALITLSITPTRTLNLTASPYPTLVPTTIYRSMSPTSTLLTPTGINVVTTPIVTSALAQTLISSTRYPSSTVSAQTTLRPTVNSLPSAGMFNTTLIIFAAAISMIFFSFLL